MQKRLDPNINIGEKQEKRRLKTMYNMILVKIKQKGLFGVALKLKTNPTGLLESNYVVKKPPEVLRVRICRG